MGNGPPWNRWRTTAIALALAAVVIVPATAISKTKPVNSTEFSLLTSQGQAGTLLYYRDHPTAGRRYLFAEIPVVLQCRRRMANQPVFSPAPATTRTFFIAGKLPKGERTVHLETFEPTGAPGNNSTRVMDVTLRPKPKKIVRKPRRWKGAAGSLAFAVSQQAGPTPNTTEITVCESGPITFNSTSAGKL